MSDVEIWRLGEQEPAVAGEDEGVALQGNKPQVRWKLFLAGGIV